MTTMPKNLKKYFWDVDIKKLNPSEYSFFIIERILERGDKNAAKWMLKNFKKPQIEQVLAKGRDISPKSANYWSSIFAMPKNKILCLKKSYQKTRETHWPY